MPLTKNQIELVEKTIRNSLHRRFETYNPEPAVMPFHTRLYSRWTMAGMLDLEKELKVAQEFWDFLGDEGAYDDLLG